MIKVRTRKDEKEFILLGTGYGMYRAQGQPGWGRMVRTNEGDKHLVALCDKEGQILWTDSNNIYIVSVDGVLVGNALK